MGLFLRSILGTKCSRRSMDRTLPCEGRNAGSIPAESTVYYNKVMKLFTVVFPVHKDPNGVISILLGQQPEGKPLAGYLNGYGGKVEQGEDVENAAKRELLEELGVTKDTVTKIGSVMVGEKEIVFFLTEIEYQEYKDGDEMIHNTWYELSDDSFISKMLPGDEALVAHVRSAVPKFFNNEAIELFSINKEGDEIQKATKALDTSLQSLK